MGFAGWETRRRGKSGREGDVSDRMVAGGVGELDNHQNTLSISLEPARLLSLPLSFSLSPSFSRSFSRRYLRESRERSAPVTTADCLHEVFAGGANVHTVPETIEKGRETRRDPAFAEPRGPRQILRDFSHRRVRFTPYSGVPR